MKILFLGGLNNLGDDDYINIDYIIDDITFFYYDRCEKMDTIESSLWKDYHAETYDWIIANSMGAFFCSRILIKLARKQNVLFISPYIQTNFYTRVTAAIPLPYIPNWLIITNAACRFKFKYVDFLLIKLTQTQLLKSVNKHMNTDAYLRIYKNHNMHIIYGTEDNIAKMSPMTIANLMTSCKVYPIHSKHEPFNDDIVIQHNLKRRILMILSENII